MVEDSGFIWNQLPPLLKSIYNHLSDTQVGHQLLTTSLS